MASSHCPQCGQLSLSLLASGVCVTCHGRSDETNPVSHFAPTRPAKLSGETVVVENTPADLIAAALPPVGFRFIEKLGGGGMGEVFRAEELSTGREVAVKRLHPDHFTPPTVRRFATEAALLARVNHPNVVRLHQFVPDRSDPFIVMECVPGEPLGVRVKGGRLPPLEAARLIAQAARGVEAAHKAGVIHRDLKPGNLLLTPDGVVKVADFGLGKDLDAAHGLTQTGRIVGGTPGFVAPEQVDPDGGAVGVHTDVYGLSACLYSALTGRPPFPTGSPNLYRVLSDDLTPPRERVKGLPADLDAITCKCLERDPAKRYASAAAVADDLERFTRGESTEAKPQRWAARAWGRARRTPRGMVIAWAAVAAVVVAAGVALAMIPKAPAPARTPDDELADLRARYLAGEEVVLVPEKGLPKWHEWVLGDADIRVSPHGDGAAYVRPLTGSALRLFDPPTESYTVSMELSHCEALDLNDPVAAKVGLMLFYHRLTKDKRPGHTLFTACYADFDVGLRDRGVPEPARVELGLVNLQQVPGQMHLTHTTRPLHSAAHEYRAPANPSKLWRRMSAEVSAAGVKLHWWDDTKPGTDSVKLASYDTTELGGHYAELYKAAADPKTRAATGVDPDLVPSVWRPTGGVGLWVGRSGLAFRNVTIRRTP